MFLYLITWHLSPFQVLLTYKCTKTVKASKIVKHRNKHGILWSGTEVNNIGISNVRWRNVYVVLWNNLWSGRLCLFWPEFMSLWLNCTNCPNNIKHGAWCYTSAVLFLNEMFCDIVDFPAKFQILTLYQIPVCFTCDFYFAVFMLISSVFSFTRDSIYAIAPIARNMLSPVRLSVPLYVTRVYRRKTFEVRIMKFSPYSSPIPLVFVG